LVAHVGHTSLNLSLPPYTDLWIHNAPNEFTSDDVNHLLYISNSCLSFIKNFQNDTFSSSQPLNNPEDGLSKLLELFNHILQTVLWQILSYILRKSLVVRQNFAVFSYIRSSYVSSTIDVARTAFTNLSLLDLPIKDF